MIFTETKLKGVFLIQLEKHEDERGFFARMWDKKEFENNGLNSKIVQCDVSYNKKKGTIRGMHFQINNFQDKLVRCYKGKIYDVVVDLRPESPTFKQWIGVELSDENYTMIYVPKRFAHGFQTLEDNSEIFYQMSEYYNPQGSRGFRFDDPAIAISWPSTPTMISQKDKELPLFENIQISDLSQNT